MFERGPAGSISVGSISAGGDCSTGGGGDDKGGAEAGATEIGWIGLAGAGGGTGVVGGLFCPLVLVAGMISVPALWSGGWGGMGPDGTVRSGGLMSSGIALSLLGRCNNIAKLLVV
jgi:hypothetical protein